MGYSGITEYKTPKIKWVIQGEESIVDIVCVNSEVELIQDPYMPFQTCQHILFGWDRPDP
jgi:hypothetical protein